MAFVSVLGMQHALHTDGYYIPTLIITTAKGKGKSVKGQGKMFGAKPHANLSEAAREYLATLGVKDPDADAKTAGLVWMHALAIGYSPAYLAENADGIRQDWPRIPLPDSLEALEASAALGEEVAALLDTEGDVAGVTSGKISAALKTIGLITRTAGGQIDTSGGDLAVTAGWGHFGRARVTMPGKGLVKERGWDEGEAGAIEAEATARGTSAKEVRRLLGGKTCDVHLNGAAYWRNIPAAVWGYYIGGYQVIKKWLSYREDKVLGRTLKPEEAREVMNMARRIAAIVLLQPKLDENYRKVKEGAFDWKGAGHFVPSIRGTLCRRSGEAKLRGGIPPA